MDLGCLFHETVVGNNERLDISPSVVYWCQFSAIHDITDSPIAILILCCCTLIIIFGINL